MTNVTIEDLKMIQSIKGKIKIRCIEVLSWLDEHTGTSIYYIPSSYVFYDVIIDDSAEEVELTLTERDGYGRYEDHNYTLPFEYLVNDEWHEQYLKEQEQKRLEKERRRLLEEQERLKRIEERERKEYERLKAKFENKGE